MTIDPFLINKSLGIVANSIYTKHYGSTYYITARGSVTTDKSHGLSLEKIEVMVDNALEKLKADPSLIHRKTMHMLLENLNRIMAYEEGQVKKLFIPWLERIFYSLFRRSFTSSYRIRKIRKLIYKHAIAFDTPRKFYTYRKVKL
jgi:hypothetical protein